MCLIFISSTFLFKNVQSQNLIQNGSFEIYTSPIDCNGGGGFYDISQIPAVIIVNQWQVYQSPDYFNIICNNNSERSAPLNFFGYSQPKSGAGYGGIIGYAGAGIEAKEYLYQQLSSPLINGKTYQLSFYLSLADASNGAIKNIGAYFCSTLPTLTSFSYINVTPQIENQSGFMTDTLNWLQIQGLYQAVGGEQYVIFGNFNSNANTDTIKVNTNSANTTTNPRYSYYYIDDISLIDQSTVGINELNISTKINLFPNPNSGNMQLDYNLGGFTKAEFKLYDITGKLISSKTIAENEGTLIINEQNLHNGVYFYHILIGEKTIKTDKIVIIK